MKKPTPLSPTSNTNAAIRSDSDRTKPLRRGVPIWVVLLVIVLGAGLFADQYQRAERLDARVNSLSSELEEAGQQLGAYETHLDQIRGNVADISIRMGGLKALVDLDPRAARDHSTRSAEPIQGAVGNSAAFREVPISSTGREIAVPESLDPAASDTSRGALDEAGPVGDADLMEGVFSTPVTSSPSGGVEREPDPLTEGIPGFELRTSEGF